MIRARRPNVGRLERPDAADGGDNDTAPDGSALRLQLLGGFRLLRGQRPIEVAWRTEKARSLVKILALAPGQRLHREQIFEALWPDLDPAAAANNFHFTLHAARRVLDAGDEPTGLLLRKQVLHLAPPGGVATDVAAFEAAVADARRGDNPDVCEAALALYTGDLLPEDRYEDWAVARREVLHETMLDVLARLANARTARGDREGAITALERLVVAAPAREEAHADLMGLLADAGRREAALRQYGRLRAALRHELDAEPGAASQRLYAAILAGRAAVADEVRAATPGGPPKAAGHNLPTALTSFVGRAGEIAELRALLAPGEGGGRLVSLIGAGGCGKSRLALAVAVTLRETYRDGIWFVELGALADPARVPDAVAAALGVRETAGRPLVAVLVAAVRARQLLLILDNCEHLIDACADLVAALLAACPASHILTTSREPLRVPGEHARRVTPLSLPDDLGPGQAAEGTLLAALGRSEAAQLLIARIRQRRPDFAPTTENAPAVAAICRRLDGIPLALELAAACVGYLAVEQVATRLDDALGLLIGGGRAVAPRQQTLRATLDWGYRLLAEPQQRLLRRLAPFAGGWSLEAAEAICGDGAAGGGADAVLGGLAALVERSLVQVEEHGGAVRYRLLETTRQYAFERLRASGEDEALGARHARHFLTFAEEAAPELHGPRQTCWFEQLDRQGDNLRAALGWSIAHGDGDGALRLCGALGWFWIMRWRMAEGLTWCRQALALPGAAARTGARAGTLLAAGDMARRLGDLPATHAYHAESLTIARELGDRAAIAWAALGLAFLTEITPLAAGRAQATEALAHFRALRLMAGVGFALNVLGELARLDGDQATAGAYYEERLALDRAANNRYGISLALFNLGFVIARQGEARRAARTVLEGIAISLEIGNWAAKGSFLDAAAAVASANGQFALVARSYGAAHAWIESSGRQVRDGADQGEYVFHVARARAALDAADFAAAWAAGSALSLDAAFDEARRLMEVMGR